MADDDSSTSSDSLSSNEEQSHSTSTNTAVDATSIKEMDKLLDDAKHVDDDDDDDDDVVADGVVDDDINDGYDDDDDSRKIFLSRIPQSFNEAIITRIFEAKFGVDCVVNVSIVYDKQKMNDYENGGGNDTDKKKIKFRMKNDDQQLPHRGFAFVTFTSTDKCQEAILAGTVRGSAKMNTDTSTTTATSKRKHTMYIRPVLRDDDTSNHATKHNHTRNKESKDGNNSKDICFLWKKHRCPYGEGCKFVHVGEGGCVVTTTPHVKNDGDGNGGTTGTSSKKKPCFNFKKSGKCKAGDDCPFLHDINVTTTTTKHKEEKGAEVGKQMDKSQIMCINWKNKGKCRKGEKCPYRHGNNNDSIRGTVVVGREEGKDANEDIDDEVHTTDTKEKKRKRKENKQRQSLSIRIFGLNYNTTPDDVRTLLRHCGPIMELTFPTFEDSGRSKGYCGVLFQSPKAVEKAILLDGCELHDRWLRIQEGKMFLKKWEEVENDRRKEQGWGTNDDDETEEKDGRNAMMDAKEKIVLGEFGQRVKKRKKHGYMD